MILVSNLHSCRSTVARIWLHILVISSLVMNISCTGSSPGTVNGTGTPKSNQPPIVTSAKILNDPITLTGSVEIQVDAQDPEREAVSFEYQWYADNATLPKQTNATLPAELLRQGQSVFVEIVPTDGRQKGQPYRTKSVVVGNTSPRVTAVSLTPQVARTGDRLEAQVEASDPDHDRIDLTYKWFHNDVVIKEGDESFLDTTEFAIHDKIIVEVTAHDPSIPGNSVKSLPLILGNSAPKIVSTPSTTTTEDRFDYPVKATDPDGDQLTYQLEAAPAGMTISPESGHIMWQIPADQLGTFHVKVVAKDGQGGIASQEFDLELTTAAPAKPVGG
ncbi:MAG TPA: putative Ig domain-containing protein [Nitrospira sp.]|nr:putative Ig domain-containing protein [Nitrospira sp.]